MDDDMKGINLTTDPKLESKMNFFYSPYVNARSAAFYMKFNDGAFKEELQKSSIYE